MDVPIQWSGHLVLPLFFTLILASNRGYVIWKRTMSIRTMPAMRSSSGEWNGGRAGTVSTTPRWTERSSSGVIDLKCHNLFCNNTIRTVSNKNLHKASRKSYLCPRCKKHNIHNMVFQCVRCRTTSDYLTLSSRVVCRQCSMHRRKK